MKDPRYLDHDLEIMDTFTRDVNFNIVFHYRQVNLLSRSQIEPRHAPRPSILVLEHSSISNTRPNIQIKLLYYVGDIKAATLNMCTIGSSARRRVQLSWPNVENYDNPNPICILYFRFPKYASSPPNTLCGG